MPSLSEIGKQAASCACHHHLESRTSRAHLATMLLYLGIHCSRQRSRSLRLCCIVVLYKPKSAAHPICSCQLTFRRWLMMVVSVRSNECLYCYHAKWVQTSWNMGFTYNIRHCVVDPVAATSVFACAGKLDSTVPGSLGRLLYNFEVMNIIQVAER